LKNLFLGDGLFDGFKDLFEHFIKRGWGATPHLNELHDDFFGGFKDNFVFRAKPGNFLVSRDIFNQFWPRHF